MTNHDNTPNAQLGQQQEAAGASQAGNPEPQPAAGATQHPNPGRNESLEMPQLGATFVPGGLDDYYMPEVVAPSPQRVMPEVPQNMQDGLTRMELESNEQSRIDSEAPPSTVQTQGRALESTLSGAETATNSSVPTNPQMSPPPQGGVPPPGTFKPFTENNQTLEERLAGFEAPSFSPFPKVKGENIPPSDEEKEEILWNARAQVLHSNNVGMQLSWARDTLNWVEIIMDAMIRDLKGQPRGATPKVEHELRMDALNIVNYLASQEHPEALFMRSKWLEFGKFGYRVDKREAYAGYRRAAELGWGRAEYRLGMLYENGNDFPTAIEHYNRGMRLKDSAASYRLGMMSLLGQHGQQKDYQRGLDLIQAAADTADEDAPQGAYVYGMLISRDLPDITIPDRLLPYDLQVAKMYIEKAAYVGFAKAQLKIGQAYELCQLGCDFNPAYSLHYYGLAAKQNQPEAALGVSRWFLFGYEGFFSKNEQLAFKYAQQAADQKLPTGEFAMGYYYEIGIHVEKDVRQARNWYDLAAEHGNKDAVGRLESLKQAKTLTKADHETTTLTRIKSQHGSQRGKRPERFKQGSAMPTVSESDAAEGNPAIAGKQSSNPSPRANPTIVPEHIDFPDPARPSSRGRPVFALNVDGNKLTMRPKSAAPYPEDDKTALLNPNRPKSMIPYPEDDMKPHFNPNVQPAIGPQADRPGSAFGIRPLSSGPGLARQPSPIRQSQSMANLVPPPGTDLRSRVVSAGWEPQAPAGYRQPNAGPGGYPQQRPATTQPHPPDQRLGGGSVPNDPSRNRLSKHNPVSGKAQSASPDQFPMGNYAPRTSSRPISDNYDRFSRVPTAPPGGGRVDRLDSLPSQQSHSRPPGGQGRPIPLKDRPQAMDSSGRVGSAPPSSQPRPQPQPPLQTANTVPAPAHHKPSGQGPATFEEMGIPQGKTDNDCVVM